MCGGTTTRDTISETIEGLSPRVRGNHAARCVPDGRAGSIPACAGEPHGKDHPPQHYKVYPRVCGGTTYERRWEQAARGLSPRVRGNRVKAEVEVAAKRSIPACAGEPPGARIALTWNRVYPRVCGGTESSNRFLRSAIGLSPRVRGNPRSAGSIHRPGRSIPACAGEPNAAPASHTRRTVYPRVCGGTFCPYPLPIPYHGLSPRVRGNRFHLPTGPTSARSIPACAGEPGLSSRISPMKRVYPRVCGGTYQGNG